MLSTDINITETTYPGSFNMYLLINKCVTGVILSKFSRHYLRNRLTSYIGVLGHIGVLQRKEHSPEVWHIPPGTSVYSQITVIILICSVLLGSIRYVI